MLNNLLRIIALAVCGLSAISAQAATSYYANNALFESQLTTSITDDYSNPGYSFVNTDSAMSAVLGQTQYTSTGWTDNNLVFSQMYCAGCNGSFLLDFTNTSLRDFPSTSVF